MLHDLLGRKVILDKLDFKTVSLWKDAGPEKLWFEGDEEKKTSDGELAFSMFRIFLQLGVGISISTYVFKCKEQNTMCMIQWINKMVCIILKPSCLVL